VLGVWLVVAVAVISVAGQRGGEFNDTFRIRGAESQAATDLLTERFPTQSGASGRVVFHAPASSHGLERRVVESSRAALARGQDVTGVTDPWTPGSGAVSADGRTAYVDVQYGVSLLTARHAHEAAAAVAGARAGGVRAEISGTIANAGDTAKGQEGLGILVAMVVLLVAFGSAVAMGIPIGTAVIGIVVGLAGMKIVASVTDVPTVSEMLGMMIGLGVGIDYALFVVTRHRQHLHDGMAVDEAAVDRGPSALLADPGIATVTPAVFNAVGDTAVVTANPTTAPQDAATDRLVHHLRADVIPAAVGGTGARAALTGHALETDVVDRFTQRLPWFIGAVVALSFLLLMTVFRSILVPLKAALMNLLAIAAAYGVVVAVFQWGWGKGLIGLEHTVPVNPFVPMIMFAILFGLSMDYEVFLLSRVREEFLRSGDSHAAVVEGLAGTARVITSAALIMISVFAAFVLGDSVIVKMIGVGLSVAVLLDATLVRLVLVPATMSLLGSANWWLPAWLDRLLPRLDLDHGDGGAPVPVPVLEPAVVG
jgi:uncharacterized membrane protein YdfJ with MMPL/SSD domain